MTKNLLKSRACPDNLQAQVNALRQRVEALESPALLNKQQMYERASRRWVDALIKEGKIFPVKVAGLVRPRYPANIFYKELNTNFR